MRALSIWDPIGPLIARPLEARFRAGDLAGRVDGIIVLGGHIGRVVEGVHLARRYPEARFVFTGIGEELTRTYLARETILAGRLIDETAARNTYENAVLTARLVRPTPEQRWLLVTTTIHMPRAVGVFRTAGFNVVAWPVPTDDTRFRLSFAHASHEWIGLAWYRLLGRSEALFPAPR